MLAWTSTLQTQGWKFEQPRLPDHPLASPGAIALVVVCISVVDDIVAMSRDLLLFES